MPTVLENLARWVVGLGLDDVPPRIAALARHQTMSVLAAVVAGTDEEPARQVARALLGGAQDRAGPCTVLPTGERTDWATAVTVASARGMALDYDDYLYMGHTGHSAVLGAWAFGEALGATTRDVLLAQIAANELGGRLGASCALGPQNGQAWSFIHLLEGAAVGAKLFGLDAERTAHAFAIALYQPSFTLWPGFMGPGSKVLTAAAPTVAGLRAAELARQGMTGALDVLEHPRQGLWRFFSFVPVRHMMTGLGSAWVGDTLAFKRYPGCAYVDTTLDALFDTLGTLAARRGRAVTPGEVRSVKVEASLLSCEMDRLSRGARNDARLTGVNVNFSIGLNVAIGILAGRHTAVELRQPWLDEHAEALRALASRVRLKHDVSMTLEVARSFDEVLGGASIARSLSPRDVVAIVAGYRRTLGLDLRGLSALGGSLGGGSPLGSIARAARNLARARQVLRPSEGSDVGRSLDAVDFSRFRMTFPARVTLELDDGTTASARCDVPVGAPGAPGRLEAAVEKLIRDVGRAQGEPRARALAERLARFEEESLEEVVRAACGGESATP